MKKLTPYQRIMRASKLGVGVRLSVEEVEQMSRDTAIEQLAINDDEDQRKATTSPSNRSEPSGQTS